MCDLHSEVCFVVNNDLEKGGEVVLRVRHGKCKQKSQVSAVLRSDLTMSETCEERVQPVKRSATVQIHHSPGENALRFELSRLRWRR